MAARPRRAACHMTASTNSVIRVGDEYQIVQLQQPCLKTFVEPRDKRYDFFLREKQMGTILSLEDSVGELMATSTAAPPKKFRVDCPILVHNIDVIRPELDRVADLGCDVDSTTFQIFRALRTKSKLKPCRQPCRCIQLWQSPPVEALETLLAVRDRRREAKKIQDKVYEVPPGSMALLQSVKLDGRDVQPDPRQFPKISTSACGE